MGAVCLLRRIRALALLVLATVLLACHMAAAPPAAPTATPTACPPTPSLVPPTATPPPTGPLVVFTREGSLWLTDETAVARRLTEGGADSSPLFSPDGRWVLFHRELPPGPSGLGRFELRVVGVDGAGEQRVVGPDDLPTEIGTPMGSETPVPLDTLPLQVAWLPDSRHIAFNTFINVEGGLATHDDLWQFDLQTGALTRILDEGGGGAFAFSPDGARLVVASPTAVTMMNADGSDRRTLVRFDFVNTASEYAYQPRPVWAPDGSYALVAVSSAEPFGAAPTVSLWRLPLTGDAVLLATLPGNFLSCSMEDRLWSPDRTRIAYTVATATDEPGARELVVANADGSAPVIYAHGVLDFLGWTPDSRHFAFWQGRPGEVYRGAVGEPPQRLVPAEEAERIRLLRWADGETFGYVVGEGPFSYWIGRVGGARSAVATSNDSFAQFDLWR